LVNSFGLLFAVLLVSDVLHLIDDFAIQGLLNGDVRHRRGWCCSMPMLFARRKPDHVARPDFLDGTAPMLRANQARR
jgi:hypothetical protein